MARKPSSKKPAAKPTGGDAIVDATLAEAAAMGWRETTLAGVAARAGLSLGALVLQAPTKAHLVKRFIRALDTRTLENAVAPDPADSAKDRLFEVLMRRFDALSQNRDGARAILRGVARDPATGAMVMHWTTRSAASMLSAAGLSADGLCGCARVHGVKAIMLATLRAWMKDDTDDLAATMAALDRALGQAERLIKGLPSLRRRADAAEPAEA